MSVFIYGLRCPLTNAIRYIGKSINPEKRRAGHVSAASGARYDHHTARWLRKILKLDMLPEIVVLEEVPVGTGWQSVEKRWIAYGRQQGWPLTNSTSGGEGLDYIDPEAEAAYRKNLSRAMKDLWNLPERREEASRRSFKAWADPDITKRRIANMVAAQSRPDVRARWIAAMAEINARPEMKALRSAQMKAQWQTEEYRTARMAELQGEAFRAGQAERLEKRWKDPNAREKMQDARWSEDKRREQIDRVLDPDRQAKIKAALTPEVIARRNASIKASWDRRKASKIT
jgi:hypothetical protein